MKLLNQKKTVSKESFEALSDKFDGMEETANKIIETIAEFINKFEQKEEATVNASKVEEKVDDIVTPDLAPKKTGTRNTLSGARLF